MIYTIALPELATDCGGHKAPSCEECGNGSDYCNGDCAWAKGGFLGLGGECKPKLGKFLEPFDNKLISCQYKTLL